MSPTRKALVVILDGLGDTPNAQLGDRTPLEAAHTPVLDGLVASGRCGLTDPLGPGVTVDTPTGTSVLFGVPPDMADALARGPVEAAGVELPLQPGDVVLRCNFATVEPAPASPDSTDGPASGFVVTHRRAGRIRTGTDELAAALTGMDLGENVEATVRPASQHRAVVRLRGPSLSPQISDTDPGVLQGPAAVQWCSPRDDAPESARAARAVNQLTARAFQILDHHPVNVARRSEGLRPANGVLTRGAGRATHLTSAFAEAGVITTVVAGERTVVGLARLLGFGVVTSPAFDGMPDTDLDGKMEAVRGALLHSDVVFLHVKAPDIHGHDRDPDGKRRTLERIDRALSTLPLDGLIVAVCGDHSTSSTTGDHTALPVPALLRVPGAMPDSATVFDEKNCAKGGLGRIPAADFVTRILAALKPGLLDLTEAGSLPGAP